MSPKSLFHLFIGAFLITASALANSTEDVSTFASFYDQSPTISWLWAGLAAAIVGILAFISWPILGPTMTAAIGSIGTSIGSLMGLSGIAATNAGLAFLGGGAIASGGFGIIGGTALLAAAITFSTEVILDYAIGTGTNKYEASKFADASLTMMTLPLPTNSSGPDSVEAAGKVLDSTTVRDAWECVKAFPESVEKLKECIASKQKPQHRMIRDAITAMDDNRKPLAGAEAEREDAMYTLLHFLNNDYVAAKRYALKAYEKGVKSGGSPTLPAYIYSVSLLYEVVPDLVEANAKFQYALIAEPNNPLTPVMFSSMLDRLSYRLNDGGVGVEMLERIIKFAAILPDDIRKLAIQQTLLAHALMQIKLSQQRVLSLTGTQNTTVLENPRTLDVVKASMQDYASLLRMGNYLRGRQSNLIELLTHENPWWDRVKDGQNPFKNVKEMLDAQGWPESVGKIRIAMESYQRAQMELEERVVRFEKDRSESKSAPLTTESAEKDSWSLIKWLKSFIQMIQNFLCSALQ